MNTIGIPTCVVPRRPQRARAGFTLIEMLVVIAIIGILAGLITAAALMARKSAKASVIAMEIKGDIERACIQYKEKFGEFPPDFAGLQNGTRDGSNPSQSYRDEARALIVRHLGKAFPSYVPGVYSRSTGGNKTGWNGFQDDVLNYWNIDISTASPATSLAFWLGGKPEWFLNSSDQPIPPGAAGFDASKPVKSLRGFSANATNPFDTSTSRIGPFLDFDVASLGWINTGSVAGLAYWPKAQGVTEKTSGPLVFFRAENGNYTINGLPPPNNAWTPANTPQANVKNESSAVWPAVDTTLSNFDGMDGYNSSRAISYVWVNKDTFQIFSSGADQKYAKPYIRSGFVDVTAYPTGESYRSDPATGSSFDDITNFSGGTLENKMGSR